MRSLLQTSLVQSWRQFILIQLIKPSQEEIGSRVKSECSLISQLTWKSKENYRAMVMKQWERHGAQCIKIASRTQRIKSAPLKKYGEGISVKLKDFWKIGISKELISDESKCVVTVIMGSSFFSCETDNHLRHSRALPPPLRFESFSNFLRPFFDIKQQKFGNDGR
ncbi:hypothetical protein Nepgr_014485 [Nepenthes gracilis]|uniref:Uncharacterized protein n=1 Tax=Nepenthes gracilis TaxID=150966 RepID=A0AAD3XQ64_NEPGR|nr:hypothetical protein Nepgr_014485 [Nepenthes gracilis]